MARYPACLLALLPMSSAAFAQVAPLPPGGVPGAPGVISQAPPRDTAPMTGSARIRGRVVAADTGQPLRKAQVRATAAALRENRLATTDDNGVYELKEMPAGRFQLTFEPGKPLEVGDGQTIDKVDFNLPRGAIITGRVVDEVGEPTIDVQVSAMRYQYVQGRRQLVNAGRVVTTNDIGEYRLFGLPPGQYYLSATLRTGNRFDVAVSSDRSGYAPTYYPGTPSVAEAQRLNIELGQTRTGIDVVLSPARLARITGTVVDSDGKPVTTGTLLVVQTGGAGISMASGGQLRPDGSFSIANVAPGEYTVLAMPSALGLGGGAPEQISTTVTVAGDDINGLRLAGIKASTVTGRVILPEATPGTIRASTIHLTATAAAPSPVVPFAGGGLGRVNDDLTFEMKVQPGHQLIRLGPQVPGTALKAVRLNGTDVTDTGIEFRPNEDVSGVEIELTTQVSELSGMVADARGQTAKDYSVVVFARDSARWTPGSRYFGGGRPDQDGRFKVRNLPPGDYYAIALDYLEPGSGTDPELLDRIRDRATPFSLSDGEIKALDLKLVNGS